MSSETDRSLARSLWLSLTSVVTMAVVACASLLSVPATPGPVCTPQTLRASVAEWRRGPRAAQAERRLISQSLNLRGAAAQGKDSTDPRPLASLFDVAMSNASDRLVHTIELLPRVARVSEPTTGIVLLPGFGAGIALFEGVLAQLEGYTDRARVFALDWLGQGLSSRVKAPDTRKDKDERCAEAESFFVRSLEDWRRTMRLDRVVLVAHSLGGYKALAYSLAHPDRIAGLVLVCPAGMYDRARVVAPSGQVLATPPGPVRSGADQGISYDILHLLWRFDITPLNVIRLLPFQPFMPLLVAGYVTERMRSLDKTVDTPDEVIAARSAYCFALCAARPGSENALPRMLGPGAMPYCPMLARVQPLADAQIPISFVNGRDDWIGTVTEEMISATGLNATLDVIDESSRTWALVEISLTPPRPRLHRAAGSVRRDPPHAARPNAPSLAVPSAAPSCPLAACIR